MISRAPSLTDQVKAHIKQRILDDEYADGRIPPEATLADDLGVSRTTVRDALGKLEHEGAIVRKQGAGTFVNHPGLQIRSRLEEIWSYQQVLEDHGYTPSVRVLSHDVAGANAKTADALNLAEGTPIVVIEKLFLEDDQPVVLTRNLVPATDAGGSAIDAELPIYEYLETYYDTRLAYYVSEIVPLAFDVDQARKLNVKPGTVGLSFQEVGFDQTNKPVLHASSYFRDDLLRFRLIRRRTGV